MRKLCLILTFVATLGNAAMAQSSSVANPASAPSSHTARSMATPNAPASHQLSTADRNFLRDAAHAGIAEVQASQLAATKSSDAAVKEFAQQMITDHTNANNKLKQLAAAKGISLPTEPSAVQMKSIQSLKDLAGSKFDRQFMAEFGTKAHQEAVALFRKETEGGQDNDVKSFAQQTLPTLEKHLQHATRVSK